MPTTSKIVIKIKDAFFLREGTFNTISTKLVIGSNFPFQNSVNVQSAENFEQLKEVYSILKTGQIKDSDLVFKNFILSISGLATNGKIESSFSVIDNSEAVNLMKMANDRSAHVGENLLNFYFIEVNTDEVEQKFNEINNLKENNPEDIGIDYAYIRGELADFRPAGGKWAPLPDSAILAPSVLHNLDGFIIDDSINSNQPISDTAKLGKKNLRGFKQKLPMARNQPIVQNLMSIPNNATTPIPENPTTGVDILSLSTVISLFSNCGITNYGVELNNVTVVDLEQGWTGFNLNPLLNIQGISNNIWGGGINHSDSNKRDHGKQTLNVLFGNGSNTTLNGLCKKATAQIGSTWFGLGTKDEHREAALASILGYQYNSSNNLELSGKQPLKIGDIVLLELQVGISYKTGAKKTIIVKGKSEIVDVTNYNIFPVEIEPLMYNVIQKGVNAKYIMIEAAGDGNFNLNAPSIYNNNPTTLKNLSVNAGGTGAIMVGALNKNNSPFLNTGDRIDINCFGDDAKTSGGDFNYTSLASAIVTGLVAHLQSMAISPFKGRPLTNLEMKSVLTSCIFSGPNKNPNTDANTLTAVRNHITHLP
jgi:hypothetical protein